MTGKFFGAVASLVLFAVVSPDSAKATTIDFTIGCAVAGCGDPTETFQLPQNPTPNLYISGYFSAFITPVYINGSSSSDDVYFLVPNSADNALFLPLSFTDFLGSGQKLYAIETSQLYTGPESSPTFQPGTYTGFNVVSSNYDTITITATTTPLPSTWTMLIAGFIGLGFFAYRGTKNRSAAIAAA